MSLIDGELLHCYLSRYTCAYSVSWSIDSEKVYSSILTLLQEEQTFTSPHDEENVGFFVRSMQQCCIILLDNNELAIAPRDVQDGDLVCILPGSISACVLRPAETEHWSLVSGDCFIFTQNYRKPGYQDEFECDEYITDNQEKAELFRIR
jgi:hypothetical protein